LQPPYLLPNPTDDNLLNNLQHSQIECLQTGVVSW